MTRRAATLVEVLVAIFVMGIGLIALLTLFPLGALRMAQAIQDERCGIASSTATAIAQVKNLRTDPGLMTVNGIPFDPFTSPAAPPLPAPPTLWPGSRALDPNAPSFPVLLDPNGYISLLPGSQHWAPANIPGVLARRNVSFGFSKPDIYYWFSLPDDFLFQRDLASPTTMGSPSLLPPSTIEREYLYSWAYLLQKPKLADPAVVDLSVVVYRSRTFGQDNQLTLNEYVYDANPSAVVVSSTTFNPSTNTVTIDYMNNTPPPLRVGNWILDVSYGPAWQAANLPFAGAYPHGYWHRVVSINDNLNAQKMIVELQTPMRGFPQINFDFPGTVMILEGVVEVFERGAGR